ncbi:hypothetical protein QE152_g7902 [Popillia japonica]|uniref:Retrotransposon gag domain-containing protein n=1 Tax=Popillia japonica TaxID=7064 RepID=A0AAW1MDN1_POPJA
MQPVRSTRTKQDPDTISCPKFYGWKRFENLGSAADSIEAASSNSNIDDVIITPNPDILTDTEEYDDDDLGCTEIPQDIPGTVELFVSESDDGYVWDSSDDKTLHVLQQKLQSGTQKQGKPKKFDVNKEQPVWLKTNSMYSDHAFLNVTNGAELRQEKVAKSDQSQRFNNWDDLVSKLKQDFLPCHYDDDLLEEINRRTQGPQEKAMLYICAMEGLFDRLSVKPDELTIVFDRLSVKPDELTIVSFS